MIFIHIVEFLYIVEVFYNMDIWTSRPPHTEDNINGSQTRASGKSSKKGSQPLAFGWTLFLQGPC